MQLILVFQVHSKGVNIELVEKLLFDLEIKFKGNAGAGF